jgi:hypothetical protein
MAARLEGILRADELNVELAIIELTDIIPGLNSSGDRRGDGQREVFNNLTREELDRFVVSKRLGSPEHYRYYFAFVRPAGALTDEEVEAFISLCEHAPNEAIARFFDLTAKVRPQGGTMAEVLTDRLVGMSDSLPEVAIPAIFASFARTMDELALSSQPGDFGQHRAWNKAERGIKVLLKRVTGEVRTMSIRTLFEEGHSIAWLSSVLRGEIFSHGLFGERRTPENQWLLTTDELREVLATMFKRYREIQAGDLMRAPDLLTILFAWHQGGGADEVRNWVEAQTRTDAGLLQFLSRTRGWAAGSEGVYHPLKRRELEHFLDFDRALQRLAAIADNPNSTESERKHASELIEAAEQDKRW